MARQRFSFGMQFGLILRYFLRHATLILLMAVSLAGALYLQIPIYRSGMDLEHRILLSVIELIGAGFILCALWFALISLFINYTGFREHVAKTTRNQRWLSEFTEKDENEDVRYAAAARISNPDELLAIALQDDSKQVRGIAARNLRDEEKAEELIARSKDASIRAEATNWIKNESLLLELIRKDPNSWVRIKAAQNINSTENLLALLCENKESEIWKECLSRLIRQTIQDGKLPIEIVTKLKESPLGGDWLKKTVCPHCYFSEYRVDERAGESELVYWASDNVVYESHTITYFVCESCGHEETGSFFVPLSSFFPDEA